MIHANKRSWWLRIHISTAMVLMFAAGGGLWINTQRRTTDWDVALSLGHFSYKSATITGWPFAVTCNIDGEEKFDSSTQGKRICVNILIWLTLLLLVAAVCEYRIRRHEKS